MPLLDSSPYHPPLPFRNGHIQTIYPALLRRLPPLPFRRQRIPTPDGDFLDLDWLIHDNTPPTRPLVILTHGLEGSSEQTYIRGMARAFFQTGWDVLAWNFRGCSGEPNLRLRSYHSGATDDLETVIAHACALPYPDTTALRFEPLAAASCSFPTAPTATGYRRIALVGFSLGGNIVLKYLGQSGKSATDAARALRQNAQVGSSAQSVQADHNTHGAQAHGSMPDAQSPGSLCASLACIMGAVAVSVPCDLAGSTTVLERRRNRIYMERFLKTLRQKIRGKYEAFPDKISIDGLDAIRTFREFDDRYTAPLHGFVDADHYWHTCSCLREMEYIRTPALLLNAEDDPFLSSDCFPTQIARKHPALHLEVTRHGGHVGFVRHARNGQYYSEWRALEFLNKHSGFTSEVV